MIRKNITRRQALKQMGGLALGSTLLSSLAASPKKSDFAFPNVITHHTPEKPNILWITLEGVPISMLSSYQNTRWGDLRSSLVDTPNLDRIAQEGMQFQNSFCTNALCAPSRATMLTGKYSHENGVLSNETGQPANRFSTSQETFPQILRRNGYNTGMVGKWHLHSSKDPSWPANPGEAGFDYFIFKRGAGGPYYNPDGYLENPMVSGRSDVSNKDKILKKSYPGYITDNFTKFAIQGIEKLGEPFLMMPQFFNAHRPFDPSHKYEHLYDDQRIPEPSTFWDDYEMRSAALRANHLRVENMNDFNPPQDLTDRQRKQWNYQKLMQHFLGTLKSLDENIGRLLDYLDKNELTERTIVVLTGDHGFFLGEHGLFDKRFMYEESIRVPWIIRYPGMIEPGKTDKWVINTDNAPTILDLVNLPVPDGMQGKSLVPILKGNTPADWRTSMYYHFYEEHWALPSYGIRTKRYKLIHYYTINEWELFDLEKDPDEMENLFETQDPFAYGEYKVRPGYKSVVKDLLKQLNKLRKKYNDTTIEPVDIEAI